MIVFKNNNVEVEDPKEIVVNGVYYGIIIYSVATNNNFAKCYIYIPEIFGPFDHIYNNAASFPCVEIPLKQDDDDEGHVPEIGELVKVSFNDGNVNSCKFHCLIPIHSESRVRNYNYITKGILSAEIIDGITDEDILNAMSALLKYAYLITIGKEEPDKNSFKIKYLRSNNFFNYFLEPLIMPLSAIYTIKGEQTIGFIPPLFSSTVYLLADVILQLHDIAYDEFIEIFNNPPVINKLLWYENAENAFANSENQEDTKVCITTSVMSGIAADFLQIIYPDFNDDSVLYSTEIIADGAQYPFTMYRGYEDDVNAGMGENKYSNFLYKYRKNYYEKEWAQSMVAWLTGLNGMLPDKSTDFKLAILFCINLCPWLATTVIGYNSFSYEIMQRAKQILSDQYANLQNLWGVQDTSYNSVFNSEEEYQKTIDTLFDVINKNPEDYNNGEKEQITDFINTFQNLAKQYLSYEDEIDKNTWEFSDMDAKFERLKQNIDKIISTYKEVTEPAKPSIPGDVVIIGAKRYFDSTGLSHDLQDYIYTLCQQNGVPYELIFGLMKVESGFNPNAVSSTNDYGLCQINEINFGWLSEQYGITDFLDPYQNVLCGISILGSNIKNYGTYEKALMAYNMGGGGASSYWEQGIFSSEYSRKVMEAYNEFLRM